MAILGRARNVFVKIGADVLDLCSQRPRDDGRADPDQVAARPWPAPWHQPSVTPKSKRASGRMGPATS